MNWGITQLGSPYGYIVISDLFDYHPENILTDPQHHHTKGNHSALIFSDSYH